MARVVELTLGLVRVANDAVIDAMARSLRPMDLMAEDAGDDFMIILPELDEAEGATAMERLLDFARGAGVSVKSAMVHCPQDGTTVEALIGAARAALRTGKSPREAAPARVDDTIVLDPAMRRVYTLVDRIAATAMTVLILGETGVGKEGVAEAIHKRSSRSDKPLIKLNCAALPEALLESELFGYEQGAFTGADKRKTGLGARPVLGLRDRYFGRGDVLRDARLRFDAGARVEIDSLFQNCTIHVGEQTELVIGETGVLADCEIVGAGNLTVHGKFFERNGPGIVGLRKLHVSTLGVVVSALAQDVQPTQFVFDAGCQLRLKIMSPAHQPKSEERR